MSGNRQQRSDDDPAARNCQLAQTCWHLGDLDAADAAARAALAADPDLSDAVFVSAMIATERGDGPAALACYRRLATLNPNTARWSLKLVQLLNWLGHIDEAVAELAALGRKWPNDPMVRTYMRGYGPASALPVGIGGAPDTRNEAEIVSLAARAPDPARCPRQILVPDPLRDIEVVAADAATGVLVFTGSNDALSMPLPLFDRYLAWLNVTAIYVKDFNRLRFLRGVRSLGEDYPATVAALRELVAGLGVTRLCAIGNCDGGFAAIRYGVELGADRVLAFGPPTHDPPETLTKLEQSRNFMRHRLAAAVSPDMLDLKPFLQARAARTRIELFFEDEDVRDRLHATHLAGLPGVALHPQPGLSHHFVLRRLAMREADFAKTLAGLLGMAAP